MSSKASSPIEKKHPKEKKKKYWGNKKYTFDPKTKIKEISTECSKTYYIPLWYGSGETEEGELAQNVKILEKEHG